jgi:MFS family permease
MLLSGAGKAAEQQQQREPTFFLALLCSIAAVNYIDRGALNGALTNVKAGLCLTTTEEGWVVSAFTIGYIISAPIFAHLSSTPAFEGKSFRLMGLGLLCFVVGSAASFLAVQTPAPMPAFPLLLVARAVVGVGEAAFLVLAPPFIDNVAPPDAKGLWLALFYAMIPFGMAIGFGMGGFIGGYGYYTFIFLIDAALMSPFVFVAMTAPKSWEPQVAATKPGAAKEPFWSPMLKLCRQPPYVCLVLGYSAYTFTIGGFSVFAPQFLQYTYEMQQGTANLVFGGITAATGLVGTGVGGWLLDQRKSPGSDSATPADAAWLGTQLMVAALPLCFLAFIVESKWAFFFLLGCGELIIFAKEGPINSAILWSVGEELKPHAMAFSMLAAHLFGDIPSPVILGYMLDSTADFTGTYTCESGLVPDPKQPLPWRCVKPDDSDLAQGGGCAADEQRCTAHCDAACTQARLGLCHREPAWQCTANFSGTTACGGARYCETGACVHPEGPMNFHGNYRLVMGVACVWLVWSVLSWGGATLLLRRRSSSLLQGIARGSLDSSLVHGELQNESEPRKTIDTNPVP